MTCPQLGRATRVAGDLLGSINYEYVMEIEILWAPKVAVTKIVLYINDFLINMLML